MGVVLPGERNPASPRLGVRRGGAPSGEEIFLIFARKVRTKTQTFADFSPLFFRVFRRFRPVSPAPGRNCFSPYGPPQWAPPSCTPEGNFYPLSPVSPRPGLPRNGGLPLRQGMAKAQTPGGNPFPWLLSTSILPCMTGAEKAFTGTCSVFILCYKP